MERRKTRSKTYLQTFVTTFCHLCPKQKKYIHIHIHNVKCMMYYMMKIKTNKKLTKLAQLVIENFPPLTRFSDAWHVTVSERKQIRKKK